MRRLDFEVVAAAMIDSLGEKEFVDEASYRQWWKCCVSLADAFQLQSQAFDRKRFLHNCGAPHPLPGFKIS